MRIGYSDEEGFAGQFELWQANCRRSLAGKKGQQSLRELEVALLALPTKRLIENELDNGADCCAIGALVRHKGVTPSMPFPDENMEDVGVECGMPPLVAWKVVELNDMQLGGYWQRAVSPEERYVRVLQWTQALLRGDMRVAT